MMLFLAYNSFYSSGDTSAVPYHNQLRFLFASESKSSASYW